MTEQEARVEAIHAAVKIVNVFKDDNKWTAERVIEIAVVFEHYINDGWEITIDQAKV